MQLLVILVHIVGMWYVFVEVEHCISVMIFPRKKVLSILSCMVSKCFCYDLLVDACMNCFGNFQESGQVKMVFKGHSDYLHCIVAKNTTNQVRSFLVFFKWLFHHRCLTFLRIMLYIQQLVNVAVHKYFGSFLLKKKVFGP